MSGRFSQKSRLKACTTRLRLAVCEALERRRLLTVFYDYDVIARAGSTVTTTGDTIASFQGETSINNDGRAAFVANVTGANGNGRALIASPAGIGNVQKISFSGVSSGRSYDIAQINNDNRVVTTDSISGTRLLRTWDANSAGSFSIITRTDTSNQAPPPVGGTYASVQLGSRAEDGETAYVGFRNEGVGATEVFLRGSAHLSLGSLSGGGFRLSAGNGGRVVTRTNVTGAPAIVAYSPAAIQTLASSGDGFTQVSQPGMSDDGLVIAFAGTKGADTGIWMSHYDTAGNFWNVPFKVAGGGSELGFDAAGNGIFLNAFDFSAIGATLSNRVGVVHRSAGPAGMQGDVILISFIATPSAAGRANPQIAASPFLYTANKGLWTLKVLPTLPLNSVDPAQLHFNHKTSPMPVMQVGDTVDGQVVTDLFTYDSIATAQLDQSGNNRPVINDADHYVVFRAATAGGDRVIRAAQLDTDADGLYDHWERVGGGIDIDRDGAIDLDLNAMGANPQRKDLFLELDWLKPDTVRGRNYSPQPQALTTFVNQFANAPLVNPAGPNGVTLHIDAGPIPGLSRNMGAGSLQGGDNISQTGTGNHIHLVYFGLTDPLAPFPGNTDLVGRPLVTRSMEDIKKNFFSTTDKGARDLAFKYALMADHYDVTTDGAGNLTGLDLSSGLGEAGQFPGAAVNPYLPGNDFLVTLQGSRGPAGNIYAVPTPVAGAPPTARAAVGFSQAQTLAHELGHTLGLLHGGNDFRTTAPPSYGSHVAARYKPTYRSLMSYVYQLDPDTSGIFVTDYSGAADPIFNDWANLNFNFNQYFEVVGATPAFFSRGGGPPIEPPDHGDLTMADFVAVHGPLEFAAPSLTIDAPAANAQVGVGSNLTVTLTASDNSSLASVKVSFDVNGDGTIGAGETIDATPGAGSTFSAVFNNVQGAAGARVVTAVATDSAEFETEKTVAVNVTAGGGDVTPPAVTGSVFNRNASPHSISFTFSENVKVSIGLADVVVSGGASAVSFVYDDNTNTVTFIFAGILADGAYRAILQSGGIEDGAGNDLPPGVMVDFYPLGGDFNGDRTVNHVDFNILFANFGMGNRVFADGDFDRNGAVNFVDFQRLETAFGKTIAPIPAGVFSAKAIAPVRPVKVKKPVMKVGRR